MALMQKPDPYQILKEPPEGSVSTKDSYLEFFKPHIKVIRGYYEGQLYHWVYCHQCGGWVPGNLRRREENSMSFMHPLSGRKGLAYLCPRGHELAFDGVVA